MVFRLSKDSQCGLEKSHTVKLASCKGSPHCTPLGNIYLSLLLGSWSEQHHQYCQYRGHSLGWVPGQVLYTGRMVAHLVICHRRIHSVSRMYSLQYKKT